jgi:cytochrome c oxidase subunit IV
MSHSHAHVSLKQYLGVFAALMVLLVVTILLAEVNLGVVNTPVAIAVASIKTVLVVTYFMHLRYGTRLAWLYAAAGFVWLVILVGGVLTDYASRYWFPSRLGELADTVVAPATDAATHEKPASHGH